MESDILRIFPFLSAVFILTYGFVGLQLLNIELGDPLGDNPLFLDHCGLAGVVFDDIYVAMHDVDGAEASQKLKDSIKNPIEYEKDIMEKHKIYTHATGDWHKTWGEDFGDALDIDILLGPPRKYSHGGISSRNLFSSIISGSLEGEDGTLDLFDSEEKITVDLSEGKIESKVRSWTKDYKKRQSLY